MYKGESFDLWNPDTGIYYAWADPEPVIQWLQAKRLKAGRSRRDSPHREFKPELSARSSHASVLSLPESPFAM